MAYTYPVKWITSAMRGAPQISGTAGTFIGALDAFLLTGWGTATALSVSVSGGVGTAIFPDGTFFDDHAVVLIAGATTPAALNGEARVLSHTNNSIAFETNAPDGVATTGTSITVKYAPVGGWSKPFQGANLAVYKSTDVQSPGHCFRMDGSGATAARVVGYETMSDVYTGVGAFPTAAMMSGGGYLVKSSAASSTAVPYSMVGDSRLFLVCCVPYFASTTQATVANVRGFGDTVPLAPSGDAWSTVLSAEGSSVMSGFDLGALSGSSGSSGTSGFCASPRGYAGLGTAVWMRPMPESGSNAAQSGLDASFGTAPSPVDGQVKLSRMFLREQIDGYPPRVVVPGVCYVPQTGVSALLSMHSIMPGTGAFAGRKLLTVHTGTSASSSSTAVGAALIDITGPWR